MPDYTHKLQARVAALDVLAHVVRYEVKDVCETCLSRRLGFLVSCISDSTQVRAAALDVLAHAVRWELQDV
jgi:hypothetical protein